MSDTSVDDDLTNNNNNNEEGTTNAADININTTTTNPTSPQTEFHENPLRSYDGWWWFLPEQHGTDSSVTFTANDVLKKFAPTTATTSTTTNRKDGFVVDKKKFSVTLPISSFNQSTSSSSSSSAATSLSPPSNHNANAQNTLPTSPSTTVATDKAFIEDPYRSSTWCPFSTFDVDRLEEAFQQGQTSWDSCCDVPNAETPAKKDSISVYDRTGQRLSKVHLPSFKMSPLYWPGKERPVRRSKWMRMKSCIVSNVFYPPPPPVAVAVSEAATITKSSRHSLLVAPSSTDDASTTTKTTTTKTTTTKTNNKPTSFYGDDTLGGVPVPADWEEALEDWFERHHLNGNTSLPGSPTAAQPDGSCGERWIPLGGGVGGGPLKGYSILLRKVKSDSTFLLLPSHPDDCSSSETATTATNSSKHRRRPLPPLQPIRLIRGYLPYHIALVGALKKVEQSQCSTAATNGKPLKKKSSSNAAGVSGGGETTSTTSTTSPPPPVMPSSNTILIDLPSPFDPVLKGHLPPVPRALVIAVHGIGQKMAINSGQSNFIRECRQISDGIIEALDRRDHHRRRRWGAAKSSNATAAKQKENIYVLPVNWRRSLRMLSGYFACDEEMVYSQNDDVDDDVEDVNDCNVDPSDEDEINVEDGFDDDIGSIYMSKKKSTATASSTAPPPILAFDELVSLITLDNIPFVRDYCSDVGADILLYMTPAYFRVILSTVIEEIRKIWSIFVAVNGGLQRVREASPNISLMGHSLGCAIISDLLAFTIDKGSTMSAGADTDDDAAATATTTMHPRDEIQVVREKSAAITRKLGFPVDNFFALGSPLAMFFVLKQWRPVGCFPLPAEDVPWNTGFGFGDDGDGFHNNSLGASASEDCNLPPQPLKTLSAADDDGAADGAGTSNKTNNSNNNNNNRNNNNNNNLVVTPKRVAFACRSYYNVFHPHDPIAYRVEPLVLGPRETHLNYRHPMVLPYTKNGMISIKRQVEEKISLLSSGIGKYKDDFINQVTSSFDSLPNWIKSKVVSSPLMTSVGSTSKDDVRYSDVSLPPGIRSVSAGGSDSTDGDSFDSPTAENSGSSSSDEGPEPFLLVKEFSKPARKTNPAILKSVPLTRADRLADAALKRATIGKERLLKFNRWGRTDFMVEEPLFEHQYYSLLSSHFIYWYDADIASFIMEEIFSE